MHITFVHSHYENLGIEYISAILKSAGHSTDLIFEPSLFHNFFSDNKVLHNVFNFRRSIIRQVVERAPDIVAFSVIADNYEWTLDIAREIKERCGSLIVFGGIHPTSVPANVLKDGVADYIIIGEGEYAFLDLINCLASNGDPSGIPNLGMVKDGELIMNAVRPPIKDLDVLPFPDKDLFYTEYPRLVSSSYMILGSRGCNNKCTYCWNSTIHNLYGGNVYFRRRSIDNVIAELVWAKEKYKIGKVTFYDEVFTSDKEWFKLFLHEYKEKINLPYFCCVHPSDIDAEIVGLLESSGCSAVNIGMQTANGDLRKKVLHRKGTNEEISKALALLRGTKIFVYLNVMIGLPGETEADVIESLRFCVENKSDIPAIYWLRYYPGTEIINIAKDKGILNNEDIDRINGSREYTPYAISGNTYNKDIAKLGNCILLSGLIPPKALDFILKKKIYKVLPSANLLFPLIVTACFCQRVFYGKRNSFHYFNVIDYVMYYSYYFQKKLMSLLSTKKNIRTANQVNKIFLSLSLFSFLFCFSSSSANVSVSKENIFALDMTEIDALKILNEELKADNLYARLYALEKLDSMPFDGLTQFLSTAQKDPSLQKLAAEISSLLKRKVDDQQFLLEEAVLLDISPLQYHEKNESESLKIEQLRINREYIYPNELIMRHTKPEVVKIDDDYYADPALKNDKMNLVNERVVEKANFSIQTADHAYRELWAYTLPPDNLSGYFFWDLRQWMKRYEESAISPKIFKESIILRNENGIICLDKKGKLIWYFDPNIANGEQHYQTYRHPHHNSFGYEMAVEGDRIYTEIRGCLIAVDISNIKSPRLIWKKSLGQYTICMSPVTTDGKIITGLINAKGELWITAFNEVSGDKEWEKFVGLTSFLSPASELSAVKDHKVYFGTNHGVTLSINAKDGHLNWVRKYKPKKHSLFDYWHKGYFKDLFSGKGHISYDTKLIKIFDAEIIVKTRESDYLYSLNSASGEMTGSIMVDNDKYFLLDRGEEIEAYLNREQDQNGDSLIFVAAGSGLIIDRKNLPVGKLQGVYRNEEDGSFTFKKGVHIYKIDLRNKTIKDLGGNFPETSWLVSFNEGDLVLAKDRTISFFSNKNVDKEKSDSETMISAINAVEANNEKDRDVLKPKNIPEKLNIFAEKLYMVVPEVIEGEANQDFALFLNYDQLICMDEDGWIRWISKVFFHPVANGNIEAKHNKNIRMYADRIKAYVIGNILIVNDMVNVIARDITNGKYLWSMTNSEEDLVTAKELPVKDKTKLFTKYGVDQKFLLSTNIFSLWQGKKLYLTHKNNLYQINPEDGLVVKKMSLPVNGVMSLKSEGDVIYAIPPKPEKIVTINTANDNIRTFTAKFIKDKDSYYDVSITKNRLLVHSDETVYILKKDDLSMEDKLEIASFSKPILVPQDEGFLLIDTFKSIQRHAFRENERFLSWEYELGNGFDDYVSNFFDNRSRFYFLHNGYVLIPSMKEGFLKIIGLDMDNGNILNEWSIPELSGYFYFLSDFIKEDNKVFFIASTIVPGDPEGPLDPAKTMSLIFPKLVEIDMHSGRHRCVEEFQPVGGLTDGFIRPSGLCDTRNTRVKLSNGFLEIEKRIDK